MEIVVDTLILLVILQTALRLSQWSDKRLWLAYCIAIGAAVWLATDYAAGLSKPQAEGWLHDTEMLQNLAVVCILDALLCHLRYYPGLLILPAAFYVLCQMLFTMTGVGFQTTRDFCLEFQFFCCPHVTSQTAALFSGFHFHSYSSLSDIHLVFWLSVAVP